MGGKPEAVYINKICNFLIQQEKDKNSQINVINRSKKKANTLEFSFENGEVYELYDYFDPFKDKAKKPPDYKPPEIQISKMEETIIEDDSDSSAMQFTIVHFVLLTVAVGLLCLSGLITWILCTFAITK
jgi:hypothetical protein